MHEEQGWIGMGVRWRTSGERIMCRGRDAETRHRPKLMRVVHVLPNPIRLGASVPEERDDGAGLVLECPECKDTTWVYSGQVSPCGEDAPEEFPVRAGGALILLQQSMADGRTMQGWKDYPAGRYWVYQHEKHSGHIRAPYENEDPAFMGALVRAQDADSLLVVWNVIANLLAQDGGRDDLPAGMTPTVMVDIYDTARRTGLIRRRGNDRKERTQGMQKVWDALRAMERYRVHSEGHARDPDTHKEVRTVLEHPLIVFGSTERALQPSLWKEADVPVAVEVTLTRSWYTYLRDSRYSIYIDGGGALAKLPARQPAGAWARAIGMLLLQQFRLNGGKPVSLTRKFLLTRLPASVQPAEQLLNDPKHRNRAQEYWDKAMHHLVRVGILAHPPEDDAPANGDWDGWMQHKLTFVPGTLPLRALQQRDSNRR